MTNPMKRPNYPKPAETIMCAWCHRTIPVTQSRLMWNKGTFRVCGGIYQRYCRTP